MQNEILKPDDLLDDNGNLKQIGYSKTMLLNYDRNKISVRKTRIKEWDYYLVYNDDYAVALTIDDNGYMGLHSISLIDFKARKETTKSIMNFMPLGKTNFPANSKEGDVSFKNKKIDISFKNDGKKRVLSATLKNFKDGQDISLEFVLTKEPKESMVIVTPFDKKGHFYYNQKIVGMRVGGFVKLGETEIKFDEKNTLGLLDWGRGVWTYKNTWYWGAGHGEVNGKIFGFNIGYGFGNTSNATENMLFYDGKAHKIDEVKFNIPKRKGKDDFMRPWTFTSNDNRFTMDFEPIIDRHADANALVIRSNQHQVFGKFSGKAVLDDGTVLEIKDMLGFAEKVYNRW